MIVKMIKDLENELEKMQEKLTKTYRDKQQYYWN